MVSYYLTKKEIQIISLLIHSEMTVTEISNSIERSIPWTSLCLTHLDEMEFIKKEIRGNRRIVRLKENELTGSLTLLLHEQEILNLSKIFTYSKLKILILLLSPGMPIQDIMIRADLSRTTVENNIRTWKSMGVAYKKDNNYIINPRQSLLKRFVDNISKRINQSILKENNIDGVIIWQWRDEFIFSTNKKINNTQFFTAGASRLNDLGYNILNKYDHYYYNPLIIEVTEEEALIQSLRVDRNNPRMEEYIIESINNNNINKEILLMYASKYRVKNIIKEVFSKWKREDYLKKAN